MNLPKIPQLLEAEYPLTWTTNEELKPGVQVTFPGKRWDTSETPDNSENTLQLVTDTEQHLVMKGRNLTILLLSIIRSSDYSRSVWTSHDSAPVLTLVATRGATTSDAPLFLCQTLEKKEEERGNSGEDQQEEDEEREEKKKKQEEEEAEVEEEYDEEEFEEVKPFHSICVQVSQMPDISVHIS